MLHLTSIVAFGLSLLGALPAVPTVEVGPDPLIIVIDPGHGGEDSGALGVDGTAEKDLVLAYSLALRDHLTASLPEAVVVLTRDDDSYPTLEERSQLANQLEADIFLSVHANSAANPAAQGVETFFLDPRGTAPGELVPGREHDGPCEVAHEVGVTGDVLAVVIDDLLRDGAHRRSAALAEAVQLRLVTATGAVDRGVRQGQFRVLRGLRSPAVVIELGFLSHTGEGARLVDPEYQHTVITALAEAVADYGVWSQQMQARITTPEAQALDAQAALQ
jgi:N-acetylmuramoyl-L-alanine amidase